MSIDSIFFSTSGLENNYKNKLYGHFILKLNYIDESLFRKEMFEFMNFFNQIVLKKFVRNKLEPVYPNLIKYSTLTCEKNMELLLYRYIEFPSIYVEYFMDILRF